MENRIYIWSDLHIGHDKEFIWGSRGYNSVEEMNEDLICKINETVGQEDTLWLLGDCMLGNDEIGLRYLNRIICQDIRIVLGNHDSSKREVCYCERMPNTTFVGPAAQFKYKGYYFYLSHYPAITSNFDQDKPLKARLLNLCGHSHIKNPLEDFYRYNAPIYHCEVDAQPNGPILIDNVIEQLKVAIANGRN